MTQKKQPKTPIIGIDPGIANTGFACSTCGVVRTVKTTSDCEIGQRLFDIRNTIENHCIECLPDADGFCLEATVVIEDFYGNFGKETKWLIGVLIEALWPCKLILVQPAKWVRDLFGKKNNGKFKACAIKLARKRGWCPEDQHQADAACLIEWAKKYNK